MLKVDVDKERGTAIVEASGSVKDTANEFLYAMIAVYQTVKEHKPAAAELLRLLILLGFTDKAMWEKKRRVKTRIFAPYPKKRGTKTELTNKKSRGLGEKI